jgi:alcohol dehydrogenase
MELRKFLVSEFLMGNDALRLAGRYAANFGAHKVLIVTDPGIIAAGWVKPVEDSLDAEGINYVVFSNVTPNPKDYEVMEGSKIFQQEKCDVITAVGGGSPMDCAKGIGIVCSNHKHITEFEGVDEVKTPMPPLICIPTTAGTAADISQFAIITHSKENRKIAIVSKAVVPDISLIDPQTTTTMSSSLTAATGMDALVHAFEAYVSNASSDITDLHALKAIELVYANLKKAISEPDNMEVRSKMMLGSLHAGMAFSNASLGIVHAMAHSLGGLKDSPHGECNAILLEHSIDFNYAHAPKRYKRILEHIFPNSGSIKQEEIKMNLIKMVRDLRLAVGITTTLSDLGIEKSDLHQLALNANNDACLATNPVDASLEQIEAIYEKIF